MYILLSFYTHPFPYIIPLITNKFMDLNLPFSPFLSISTVVPQVDVTSMNALMPRIVWVCLGLDSSNFIESQ